MLPTLEANKFFRCFFFFKYARPNKTIAQTGPDKVPKSVQHQRGVGSNRIFMESDEEVILDELETRSYHTIVQVDLYYVAPRQANTFSAEMSKISSSQSITPRAQTGTLQKGLLSKSLNAR